VVATHDRIFTIDMELEVQQELTGSFGPMALSLDEAGRIYIIVYIGGTRDCFLGGHYELWLLTPDGERLWAYEFPAGMQACFPPIVGYDHTVYSFAAPGGYDVNGQTLYAISPDGKLRWSRPEPGQYAHAVVTADDFLLVARGSDVAAYDSNGERKVLFTFPGEVLNAPPLLTERGELIVASTTALHCLERSTEVTK
jgi:outer membrane protein assembly factor BamB